LHRKSYKHLKKVQKSRLPSVCCTARLRGGSRVEKTNKSSEGIKLKQKLMHSSAPFPLRCPTLETHTILKEIDHYFHIFPPHRYLFGSDVVAQFNQSNDVDMICRAHQLVMEGYKWHFNETVLTVWSAPNYCYRCGNVAAILELDEHLVRNFTIFEAAPQEARGVPCKKPQADYFL
jgi:hypothetical protein